MFMARLQKTTPVALSASIRKPECLMFRPVQCKRANYLYKCEKTKRLKRYCTIEWGDQPDFSCVSKALGYVLVSVWEERQDAVGLSVAARPVHLL